jgi:hypothetical protein
MAKTQASNKRAADNGEGSAHPQPTAQEGFFFLSIIRNLTNRLEVDWDKVALESGHKSADVAKVSFQTTSTPICSGLALI